MAMKKKFLGLALATMVAMPATGVYAAGSTTTTQNSQTITSTNASDSEVSAEVDVNGEVLTQANESGKIQVEIPTALAFTIDAKGELHSVGYKITNKSSIGISVSVAQFTDTTVNKGITVHSMDENISKLDRSNLHLELIGDNNRTVDLGKYIDKELEILNLEALQSKNITLRGESGKATSKDIDDNGVSDRFILTFKIKKN